MGEGLTEADIVTWRVKPGDTVTVNQIIVDIETAKAVVELPSPYAGVVAALLVPEGQTVDVGTPIIAVDVPGAAGSGPAAGGTRRASPGGRRRPHRSGRDRGGGPRPSSEDLVPPVPPARGTAGRAGRLRRQGRRDHPAAAQGTSPAPSPADRRGTGGSGSVAEL